VELEENIVLPIFIKESSN